MEEGDLAPFKRAMAGRPATDCRVQPHPRPLFDQVYAQWQKDTDVGIIVEVLAALRNLVLHPQGAEAFMTTDGLDRMFTELDRGALSSKLEAKVVLWALGHGRCSACDSPRCMCCGRAGPDDVARGMRQCAWPACR